VTFTRLWRNTSQYWHSTCRVLCEVVSWEFKCFLLFDIIVNWFSGFYLYSEICKFAILSGLSWEVITVWKKVAMNVAARMVKENQISCIFLKVRRIV